MQGSGIIFSLGRGFDGYFWGVEDKKNRKMGVARRINKAGLLSRSKAEALVCSGKVTVNGRLVVDPEHPTYPEDQIHCEGKLLQKESFIYLILNKPRGLVTSAEDQQGRPTVYECLKDMDLPHVGPVGRLDKASEGLLLFTNDTVWANALLDPHSRLTKKYHVQIHGHIQEDQCQQMLKGIELEGVLHVAFGVTELRRGDSNSWLEIILSEGKNREIRKMLDYLGFDVLRLIRVAFGPIPLGELPKGAARMLTQQEIQALDHAIDYTRFVSS